jgi:2-amino-4-hydroxy-6-hydroxymethyldihydropteridine diphosphokinase
MTRCYIALGGNVGPVEQTLEQALDDLAAHPRISLGRISSLYRTQAVGARSGGEFLNAAAELETELQPEDLLDVLHAVEDRHGRARVGRWTPRTLDLDLLLYGDRIIDLPRLRVPHPACWYRRFVLDPLAEIAADVVHPEREATIGELRKRLLVRPLRAALAGGEADLRRTVREQLIGVFADAVIEEWPETGGEASLVFWLGENPRQSDQPSVRFADLPQVSRLDATQAPAPAVFIRDVLSAALG